MNKETINKYCRKFGFEVHGIDSMHKFRKMSLKENAFIKQKDILGENVSCIFDVGANRGETVIEYNNLFPNASIYAFEPFPGTYDMMADKIKGITNIKPFQKAVADKKGKGVLYVNNSVDTNSLLPSKISGLRSDKLVANKKQIEVDICVIDQFCEVNNINRINILKLDIQGGELAALKGCEKMLSTKKIDLIYTEAYFIQQYVGHPLFHDIYGYLYQYGYRMQDIYDPVYGNGSIAWCDVIFLPSGV